ncbi:hypothetical protein C491_10804 [Natronococcus amylolyticus DSM 10524]|uniref:Uncharacterized protein n=1 Tax=Natronococcus amylolyticus DSM 10524 TaxID=1227497 RepID=L9X626_9EURY|nr:hypothetical protein [Natronococcus amylolyticus]ELY57269.1 hypothetical protein C491_10804 [Natronococcus amylolyticus DSM 10524]
MIGSDSSRGQAYALEGTIAATILLVAFLVAAQSAVVAPVTEDPDRATQSQLQQETRDALVVAAGEGDLSATVRSWHDDASTWADDAEPGESAFYGADRPPADGDSERTYSPDAFAERSTLGAILEARFGAEDRRYNVEIVADEGNDGATLVDQGTPSAEAVTATYVVTLHDDDRLTAEGNRIGLERAYEDQGYPIAPADDARSVYALVEVRVTVW